MHKRLPQDMSDKSQRVTRYRFIKVVGRLICVIQKRDREKSHHESSTTARRVAIA